MPDNVVDWVLVELKNSPDGSVVSSQSLFLHKNGNITEEDGVSGVICFDDITSGSYYLSVKHRNHINVISPNSVGASTASLVSYDFSENENKYYSSHSTLELESGVWGIRSGDINQDGEVTTFDYTMWYSSARVGLEGYEVADVNLDGVVTTADYTLWYNSARSGASARP